MGIGMGASVMTSRFWGMKDLEALKRTVTLMRVYTPDEAVIAQGILMRSPPGAQVLA